MTDRQFASLGPQFEADVKRNGLRTALEKFLGRAQVMLAVAPRKPSPGEMPDGVRRIVDLVAKAHGVPSRQVIGMDRRTKVIAARHEAWFRLGMCGFSGPRIAKMFRCNPSAIVPARRSFRENYPEKAAEIEQAALAPLHAVPVNEEGEERLTARGAA